MGPPSESGQSSSSFGSGVGSDFSEGPTPAGGEESDGLEESSYGPLQGVWGLLYTVSKEKNPSSPFVAFRLFFDWLQLFLIIVNPAYGWDIPAGNKVWQVFSFVTLNEFMTARGYTFFIVCLYIFAAALACNVALCIWVSISFQQNKFDHVWPIVWLRYFSLIFYQVLDVASLSLFLIALDCQYFSVPDEAKGHNQEFGYNCWSTPYVIHAGVAATALVVFFVLATVFSMSEIELNPVSRNLMGMAHTKVEGLAFLIKTIMTCTSVFVNSTRWASVIQLGCTAYLTYLYFYWAPHLHNSLNYIRTGYNASVFYAALLFVLVAYTPSIDPDIVEDVRSYRHSLTVALWAGFVPVGLVGALASYLRVRFFMVTVVNRFRDAPEGIKPKFIYKFTDPREVEIVSRCCRKWVDEDTLDEDSVKLAEQIIKAGMTQMPHNAYMVIWYSSFLIDVQGSYQSGYTELQAAKKAANQSFLERFCIFIRDQEHTQKASAATSGENANVDLVSYVEFQRNYRLAMRLHLDALQAKRLFWESLLHANCSFDKLSTAVARIEFTMKAAERMYKQVLSRHGNSVKILLLWVKYLQSVKNDPWSAAKWQAEAEKLQKAEEEANERAVFGGQGAGHEAGLQNHDDSKGIIVMSANCLVKMANDSAAQLLGYGGKAELIGKNVNVIVPPPFARNHNNYVRNYIQTGKAHILDNLREFVALHKDRYVVPIQVFVTKVSGIGEDSTFLGMFTGIPPKHNVALVWVMNGGLVLSCDGTFTDWLGYKQEDLHAKPVSDLVVQKEEFDQLMITMKNESAKRAKDKGRKGLTSLTMDSPPPEAEHSTPSGNGTIARQNTNTQSVWYFHGLRMKHMYLENEEVVVDAEIKVGGIGETALYVISLKRTDAATRLLMVTDAKGRVIHATSALAAQLGSTGSKLQAGNTTHALDQLLPPPLTRVHHNWYHDKPEVVPRFSCRSGLSVFLPAATTEGVIAKPFSLSFRRKDISGRAPLNVVILTPRTQEQVLDERRLRLVLDSHGVVTWAGGSPNSLFGFDPQALVGHSIAYVIDVLRPTAGPEAGPTELLEGEELASKMLFAMAEKTYTSAGLSWRVGVSPIIDPVQLLTLGPMGSNMVKNRAIVPAVMTVSAYMDNPELDGARMQLPHELQLEVELWRSDLLSGVMEVDSSGSISMAGVKDMPTFSPGLLLGVGSGVMQGQNISQYLPLHGKPLMEVMFTEGAFGGKGAAGATGPKKSGMKAGTYSRRRAVGPVHHVRMRHQTDGEEVEVTVQAVMKQDVGSASSVYIMMHVESAKCGREDFRTWLFAPPPLPKPQRLHLGNFERSSVASRVSRDVVATGRSSLVTRESAGLQQDGRNDSHNNLVALGPGPSPGMSSMGLSRMGSMHKHVPAKNSSLVELAPVPEAAEGRNGSPNADSGAQANGSATPQGASVARGLSLMPLDELVAEVTGSDGFPASDGVPSPNRADDLRVRRGRKGKNQREAAKAKEEDESRRAVRWNSKQGFASGLVADDMANGKNSDQSGSMQHGRTRGRAELDAPRGSDSGGDSGDGMDGPGRQRVSSWVVSSMQDGEGLGPEDDDEEEYEDEDEEGSSYLDGSQEGGDKSTIRNEDDDEAEESGNELEELDEAGAVMTDYMRGKRFKRLSKLLASPQAQSLVYRLRWVSLATVAVLILADLAMFMAFYLIMLDQRDEIHGLDSAASGAARIMQSSISVASLSNIYGATGSPGIRYLSSSASDRDHQLSYLQTQTDNFDGLHRGVYQGFSRPRRMPVEYGLRDMWELPHLPTLAFYDSRNGTINTTVMASLWDAGNSYLKAARSLLQNSIGWNASGLNFSTLVDTQYILWNGPEALLPAYDISLDGLVQVTVNRSRSVNDIQLVILALEGGLLGVVSALVMWHVSRQLTFRRYAIYSVFMVVPQGIVRSLATMVLSLEEKGEEQEEYEEAQDDRNNDDGDEEAVKGPGVGRNSGAVGGGMFNKKFALTTGGGMSAKGAGCPPPDGFWARLKWYITNCWSRGSINAVQPLGRRQLQPSNAAAFTLVWPFAFWAVLVIALNAVGFVQLQGISSPIALLNIINNCLIHSQRVVFYSQLMTTAPPGPYGKSHYRSVLAAEYHEFRKEYEAMLYGRESPWVSNDTSPHYTLATSGVVFSNSADILYTYRGCMCEAAVDCQSESSVYYRYTNFGLDQLVKEFNLQVETLMQQADEDINVNSPYFKFIYEVGNSDLPGGFNMLSSSFLEYVDSVTKTAEDVHIAILVLGFILAVCYIIFIMRPVIERVTGEGKRIAELLSNLPADLDVEKLVGAALRMKREDKTKEVQPLREGSGSGNNAYYTGGKGETLDGGMNRTSRQRTSLDNGNGAANGYAGTSFKLQH